MGLLDIWDDWRKETGYFKDSSSNLQTMAQNSDTIDRNKINRGRKIGISSNPMDNAINQSGSIPINRQNVDQALQKKGLNTRTLMQDPKTASAKINAANQKLAMANNPSAMPSNLGDKGGSMDNMGSQDPKWWEKLAKMANVDPDKAMASWKEKGGFEGLMANPAFTMGLAFIQAGAEGKTMGAGALDNVMKAGGISQHYKKIIKDRKQAPIQATAADMAEIESLLKTINIEEGNWAENLISKIKGGKPGAEWSAAVEEIAVKYQEEVAEWQRTHKDPDGKPKTIRQTDKIKIMQDLIKSGDITKKGNWTFGLFSADTLKKKLPNMARGGPVQAGKPYVVGEEGPEVIIPRSDGNVLSNDDSQIYAMLLASNPQLQQVSRARAEKILRSRFPEYFE